jgi:hypothetical protein
VFAGDLAGTLELQATVLAQLGRNDDATAAAREAAALRERGFPRPRATAHR